MEIRHLKKEEFYALRELLDGVFSRRNGNETSFKKLFPRLFTEPNEKVTNEHIGAFENGKLIGTAAMYELDYAVGDTHIRLVANGNVAVLEDHRGKGVMSAILDQINKECDKCADLCYLHGGAVRYGRFGYIGGGVQYKLDFQPEEISEYTFVPMVKNDGALYKNLYEMKTDYIVRAAEDQILSLASGCRTPLAVVDGTGEKIGYISLNKENAFVEEYALSVKREDRVFKSLAKELGRTVGVRLSGYDKETLERLKDCATVTESQPALFRVINPEILEKAALSAGVGKEVIYAPYLT